MFAAPTRYLTDAALRVVNKLIDTSKYLPQEIQESLCLDETPSAGLKDTRAGDETVQPAATAASSVDLADLMKDGMNIEEDGAIFVDSEGKFFWALSKDEKIELSTDEHLFLREKIKDRMLWRISSSLEKFTRVFGNDEELYRTGQLSLSRSPADPTSFSSALSTVIQPDSLLEAIQNRLPYIPIQSILVNERTEFIWKNPIVLAAVSATMRKLQDVALTMSTAHEQKKMAQHKEIIDKIGELKVVLHKCLTEGLPQSNLSDKCSRKSQEGEPNDKMTQTESDDSNSGREGDFQSDSRKYSKSMSTHPADLPDASSLDEEPNLHFMPPPPAPPPPPVYKEAPKLVFRRRTQSIHSNHQPDSKDPRSILASVINAAFDPQTSTPILRKTTARRSPGGTPQRQAPSGPNNSSSDSNDNISDTELLLLAMKKKFKHYRVNDEEGEDVESSGSRIDKTRLAREDSKIPSGDESPTW